MLRQDALYLGGEWIPSAAPGRIEVVNPADGSVVGAVPAGAASDVDAAVAAARAAFPAWSHTDPTTRLDYLDRIHAGITERAEEIAALISREMGSPLWFSRATQVGSSLAVLASMRSSFEAIPLEEEIGSAVVVREPLGVVGCITPWNYPLFQITLKIGPALAAGCTVVVKPSELAPLSAFVLAEIVDAAGLPPGVVNLVSGTGAPVGEALAGHPGIDMVSFTGSTRTGSRIAALASQTIKRVALELGGKSPFLILDDADLTKAVPHGLGKCFGNSGQTCVALTRMLVPRARLGEVEEQIAERIAEFPIGDPLAEGTRLGPLVSQEQRAKVIKYIQSGVADGARLLAGGADVPPELGQGAYVAPTVFTDVKPDMRIAREEIFGPVLCVIPFEDDEDAIRIANDTTYGLSAAVWSSDPARADRVARELRAGSVFVNNAQMDLLAPFGGYRQSGIGREMGRYGIEEFFELKTLRSRAA
ncbi:aldehyde dehydrogenase family protein [Amycolatopsis pithecellobii]|uniref:aldehyde dehydrogenase (NAD(+)) n=1 Tax=Amycolatopsis pithecellobii TaxID=664692 RepID=A0A6N7Z903_9PSEU|nr:aldehyde dehydrogenase family protein [Amycolatopsis pithecellobii]MTD57596.1 aldehyde dehydrogenase family protein [Amycolatopsis pithecellobii]